MNDDKPLSNSTNTPTSPPRIHKYAYKSCYINRFSLLDWKLHSLCAHWQVIEIYYGKEKFVTWNDTEFQLLAVAGWKAEIIDRFGKCIVIYAQYILHYTAVSFVGTHTLQLALLEVALHLIQNNQELRNRK